MLLQSHQGDRIFAVEVLAVRRPQNQPPTVLAAVVGFASLSGVLRPDDRLTPPSSPGVPGRLVSLTVTAGLNCDSAERHACASAFAVSASASARCNASSCARLSSSFLRLWMARLRRSSSTSCRACASEVFALTSSKRSASSALGSGSGSCISWVMSDELRLLNVVFVGGGEAGVGCEGETWRGWEGAVLAARSEGTDEPLSRRPSFSSRSPEEGELPDGCVDIRRLLSLVSLRTITRAWACSSLTVCSSLWRSLNSSLTRPRSSLTSLRRSSLSAWTEATVATRSLDRLSSAVN
jgi:hypothetical protein